MNKRNRRIGKLVILFLSRWINWSNGCLLQARGVLTSKKAPSDHTNAPTLFRWDLEEDREVTLVARIDRQNSSPSSLTRFNINIIIPSFPRFFSRSSFLYHFYNSSTWFRFSIKKKKRRLEKSRALKSIP